MLSGKKVVDTTKKLTLHIERCDIDPAKEAKPSACAAARALMRENEIMSARVHVSCVYLEYPRRWVRYKTPTALRDQIILFDTGSREFEPGEYTLLVPTPTKRLGQRHDAKKGQKTGTRRHIRTRIPGVRNTPTSPEWGKTRATTRG
jgi:hypothetical protein